ncbi:MAG: DUF2312 domain-containing protein [Rhodospirillaceae bacterium]|nr:DUF2312 domain-containing protein [Rhodospirillaceae bacterium]MYF85022.1 DUF2312 domain-containing protein [Rhodospirillaceae bacterium]MYK16191.1 DUF2312 domain-containing protein [Rhodospirillaceae bacterium]MYK58624.1 DUF2312 domain-containing protein [Rhodospirillaceae bacterium]
MNPADNAALNAGSGETATPETPASPGLVGGVAGDILRAYVERIERLEEEKKALAADIREVYAEAKGNGYDPKIMRKLVALRRMDTADRREQEELLDVYRRAIGMI